MTEYVPTIGLEIHVELNTKTKMFCDCANDPLEKTPNMNVCPICMGHPGTLPVMNRAAIEKIVGVGLALGCSIESHSFFERKNYFYPDLPKGYQISQFQFPFCRNGELKVNGKTIRIERIHLEEDAGKLLHDPSIGSGQDATFADYNRTGVPLMELVTHPDLTEAEDVRRFAQELQLMLRYLGASDADMEKGQMRIEVNLSIRPKGQKEYGTKVEVKNINSISAAAKSVDYEIQRQTAALEAGEEIVQETRGWDDVHQKTVSQRVKEGSADYRYFPEPDLPPVVIAPEDIEQLRSAIPELPEQRRTRFASEYGLPQADVEILTVFKELGDYFEDVASELKSLPTGDLPKGEKAVKTAANWLITQLQPKLFAVSAVPQDTKITPALFAAFIEHVVSGQIGSTAAQTVLQAMWETGEDPEDIINARDLAQVSDEASLNLFVEDAIAQSEKVAADFKSGKEVAMKSLVGKVMQLSKGKANPQLAEKLLREKLK